MLAANPGWESKAQDLRIRNCVFLSSDKLVGSAKFVLTQRAKWQWISIEYSGSDAACDQANEIRENERNERWLKHYTLGYQL